MRGAAVSLCVLLLVGCARSMTSSPLPATFRHATMPFAAEGTIFSFSGPQGEHPEADLIAVKSVLYGTTYSGTSGSGTVFRITPSGALKVLHQFGKTNDGSQPGTGPLIYVKGNFYGVTTYGGNGDGTVYKISPKGKEHVVYRFGNPPDGDAPYGSLTYVDGNLYGTTAEGGKNDYGTVFRLSLSGKEKVLYSFKGGSDGQAPFGGLTPVGRTLYGTTRQGGGASGYGTVFKISLTGHEKVIHRFGGTLGHDGASPWAGLTLVKGQLYGTTGAQGASGTWGTVYAITTSGRERVLHSFTDSPDGGTPLYANLLNVNGTLYETTQVGGTGPGTVFKITTNGSESVVYSFPGGTGGEFPYGGVAFLRGRLYGTTYQGGSTGDGTVFSVTP